MNWMILLATVLSSPVAQSQPILFRGAGAGEAEFRARLRADEALRSPITAYLSQHPAPKSRDLLLTRFARAQRAFLEGDVGEARQYFQEVTALLSADDWRSEQREMFLHAFLRLAQLEGDGAARDRWLVEAQYLGEDLKFDPDHFPPPVTRRYRDFAHQLPRVRPAVEAAGWPLILINGIHCAPGDCPRLPAPSRNVRVTYLSDQWAPQSQTIDIATLGRLQPPRFPFVAGACARPELSTAARSLGEGRAFFGLACEAPRLAPELAATVDEDASPSRLGTPLALPKPPSQARPFYRSPWLWAGLGAAVITAVAISTKPAHRAPDPPPAEPTPSAPATIYGY